MYGRSDSAIGAEHRFDEFSAQVLRTGESATLVTKKLLFVGPLYLAGVRL